MRVDQLEAGITKFLFPLWLGTQFRNALWSNARVGNGVQGCVPLWPRPLLQHLLQCHTAVHCPSESLVEGNQQHVGREAFTAFEASLEGLFQALQHETLFSKGQLLHVYVPLATCAPSHDDRSKTSLESHSAQVEPGEESSQPAPVKTVTLLDHEKRGGKAVHGDQPETVEPGEKLGQVGYETNYTFDGFLQLLAQHNHVSEFLRQQQSADDTQVA
mmetsp:Transcript_32682/g.71375  ORF Transcript_32682/g.71375 Transcript_32682/m.71375 type:complete len:216 (-) Transcript_32682:1020-1667(-)